MLDVENTNLEPDKAQAALTSLADRGVRIVIGPQSSSEVAAISETAAARGVMVVSQGSTASSLGLPDDNVFRFVPTDRVEGRASVDLMLKNGATTIVPMWRNDRGNNGLEESVRAAATASGATVTDGVRYEPDTTDFSAALADLSTQVQAAVASGRRRQGGGVRWPGSRRSPNVFTAAHTVTGLDGVRWYGGDGSAQARRSLPAARRRSPPASRSRAYPSPLVAVPAAEAKRDAEAAEPDHETGQERGRRLHVAAYDAFNVAGAHALDTPADADPATLRSGFARTAEGAKGTTGTIHLDPAGDRVSTPYAFWSVCERGNSPRWTQTGTVDAGERPDGARARHAQELPEELSRAAATGRGRRVRARARLPAAGPRSPRAAPRSSSRRRPP